VSVDTDTVNRTGSTAWVDQMPALSATDANAGVVMPVISKAPRTSASERWDREGVAIILSPFLRRAAHG
jgi:hypothetical protein